MPLLAPDLQLCFYHVPKTGGAWVGSALQPYGTERLGGGHDSVNRTPPPAGYMTFSTVRNPWDWYVSLYLHARSADRHDLLSVWGGGSNSFRDVLYGWTHPGVGGVPDRVGVIYELDGPDALLRGFAHREGFCSYTQRFITSRSMDHYIPTDRLAEGLGILTGEDFTHVPRANTAQQRDVGMSRNYRPWYTPEMVEWVWQADGWMAVLFGFEPFGRAPQALY